MALSKRTYTVLLHCLTFLPGLAQNYNIQSYGVEHGIPQSQINVIYPDSRGYLWFGTAGGGICRFDGKDFVSYNETDGLGGPIINDLCEDGDGNLWVASTWGGLTRYDGKTFKIYGKSSGYESGNARSLQCDASGMLWVGNEAGLWKNVDDHFQRVDEENDEEVAGSVSDLFLSNDGTLWVATSTGISYIDGSGYLKTVMLVPGGISVLGQDAEGDIWAAKPQGGALITSNNFLDARPITHLDSVRMESFFLDSDSAFWVSTSEYGVYRISGDETIELSTDNGLTNNYIGCIAQDREGDIWFGTHGSGALKYMGMTFTYFDYVEGLNSVDIFAITEDADGNMWIGTGSNGIYVWDGRNTTHYSMSNGLPSNLVRQIVQTSSGDIWVATDEGAARYRNGSFTIFNTGNGLRNNNIRSIVESYDGTLWFGTYEGIANLDGTLFTTYSEAEGLSYKYVHSLYEDKDGILWIGTGNGLNRFDGEVFTSHNARLCNSYVGGITEDEDGNLWMYTDRCVSMFNGQMHHSITQFQGLSSNTAFLIQFDQDGNLWVGTNKGIDRLTFDDDGNLAGVSNYSIDEGFKGIECNTRAVCLDSENNLWFGTVKGLIKYNPQFDVVNDVEPAIHITGVKWLHQETDWSAHCTSFTPWHHVPEGLVIPFYKNYLTFNFVGISMRIPDRVTYEFMLEGFDRSWLPVANVNEYTYSNLPPGTYTFKVRAANEHGIWNKEPATFTFTITPPFWQKWWFYLLIIGLFILGIYMLVRARTRNLNRQKHILEHQVSIRVAEISRQNREKEIMLKEIHHRVKNNLQIINSLISLQSNFTTDEKALALFDECRNRVSSMALIHEKMYEAKDLANINVRDYVTELVRNLIQTYGLNQDIKLDFDIRVSALGIDTIVPFGLIMNEVVSNSLKYAFPNNGAGTVYVKLYEEKNRYVLQIGDNGVGLPEGVSPEDSQTLGLQLIYILAEQLGGTVSVESRKGVNYTIEFKDLNKTDG